jgi:tRNA threonylcarbamoyladenosine biosynthesis protein TsaE
MVEIITNSAKETIALGKKLGEQLKGGEVIALRGNLGTGKTHLIKGIAAGAGVEESDIINSPTFVLVNEYQGRFMLFHIDAYRLENEKDFEHLGFDDMTGPVSVVLIEWADKVENVLEGVNAIDVSLYHDGTSSRKIRFDNLPGYVRL